MERALKKRGQLYLFESKYSADVYLRKVGRPGGLLRVVHNGIREDEFEPIALSENASDVVYLGELRHLKGVDVLLEALAKLSCDGRQLTATLVGDGPDEAMFQLQVRQLGLTHLIVFRKSMPAREALSLGRIVVMPSRAESLPYVVLEALAASKRLVATHVGGIPEIFGPYSDRLVAPDDANALGKSIVEALDNSETAVSSLALRDRLKKLFSVDAMVESVLEFYGQARSELPQMAGGSVTFRAFSNKASAIK
jgi:glycosyltransferase involved in cell wall biosynthesis